MADREMTLEEYVGVLHDTHIARIELKRLTSLCAEMAGALNKSQWGHEGICPDCAAIETHHPACLIATALSHYSAGLSKGDSK